jgi:anti-anti-sigma regulatory factor
MPTITQRQIVLIILGFSTTVSAILAPYTLMQSKDPMIAFTSVGGAICFGGLWLAYWRGWEWARYLTVIIITILSVIGTPVTTETIPATALIVPILALVLTEPAWVIGGATVQMLGLIARSYQESGGNIAAMGGFGNIADLLLYTLAIAGLVLSRTMLDTLLHSAQESARRDSAARDQAEAQSQAFADQARALDRQLAEQRRLIDLVSTLETPAVSLAEGVLLAPVVGNLDGRRAQNLTERLLREVSTRRAHMIVLDIAGVPSIDTEVANALLQTVYALRLLGCQVTLTGISAAVAASLTSLGISLGDVQVARSPQDVLRATVA